MQAQQPAYRRLVHPARRPGVPRPAAAADMHRMRVDVGGDRVWFDAIPLAVFGRPHVVDGIDHVEQFHRLVAHAEPRQGENHPGDRVCILTAVLADTGHIAFDVAGIVRHPIEWRREQQHHLGVAPHEMRTHRVQCPLGARGLRGARQDGPRLRQRIELAFVVLHRPERRPVVEVGATVPVAVPRQFEHPGQPSHLFPIALCQIESSVAFTQWSEIVQHGDEKPAEPHALALTARPDPVHAVVPVAGTHLGQAAGADLE